MNPHSTSPAPTESHEAQFSSLDGLRLLGDFTMPANTAPTCAVILVHGGGVTRAGLWPTTDTPPAPGPRGVRCPSATPRPTTSTPTPGAEPPAHRTSNLSVPSITGSSTGGRRTRTGPSGRADPNTTHHPTPTHPPTRRLCRIHRFGNDRPTPTPARPHPPHPTALAVAVPSPTLTSRDTRTDPRRPGEPAAFAAAVPSSTVTSRDTRTDPHRRGGADTFAAVVSFPILTSRDTRCVPHRTGEPTTFAAAVPSPTMTSRDTSTDWLRVGEEPSRNPRFLGAAETRPPGP